MKRQGWFISLVALAALVGSRAAEAANVRVSEVHPQLVPVPVVPQHGLGIQVWTDAGEGTVLRPGALVDVYFRVNRSAYVAVVDIDTRGRARLLYPTDPEDDGFVRAGRLVALPGPRAEYRLMVEGPSGVERIVALASDEPLTNCWRRYLDEDVAAYDQEIGGYDSEYTDYSGARSDGSRGQRLEPQLVPVPRQLVPVPRHDERRVVRDETWFEVARKLRHRAPKY